MCWWLGSCAGLGRGWLRRGGGGGGRGRAHRGGQLGAAGVPVTVYHSVIDGAVILGVVGEPLGFWANFDGRPRGRSLALDGTGARCSSTDANLYCDERHALA